MAKPKRKHSSRSLADAVTTFNNAQIPTNQPTEMKPGIAAQTGAPIIESAATAAAAGSPFSYDQVPYPSHPYAASHPDRMCSMARIFGLQPPNPDHAKVLELGCAAGGNLLPMAAHLPEATFVGVDLSAIQIDEGSRAIAQLGLKNVRLLQADIANLPVELGEFDYIICHGVFSWVPPHVRQAILQICGERLSPSGIAYISYNTLPGWYMRNMIRGMMLKHVGQIAEPAAKLVQARALLKFLVESTANEASPYAAYLRSETDLLDKQSDQYLFHDHLEEHNEPMFFQDFVALAGEHGLQFLGEASLASMWIGNLPAKAVQTLEQLTNDAVLRGQYADYVRNRTFRQTLLCRNDLAINRQLDVERLVEIRISGRLLPDEASNPANITSNEQVVFRSLSGHRVTSGDPIYKAMLTVISDAFPQSLPLDQICARVNQLLGSKPQTVGIDGVVDRTMIGRHLIQLLLCGAMEFRYGRDRFAGAVGEKPRVPAWARWQAERGNHLTNLRHEMIRVCDVTRVLVPLFDGTRNRAEIAEAMLKMVEMGSLNVNSATELTSAQKLAFLQQMSDKILGQLAATALLCA